MADSQCRVAVLVLFAINSFFAGLWITHHPSQLSEKQGREFISLDETPGPAILSGIQCPLCKRTAKLVEINEDTHSYAFHGSGDIYDCGTHQTECKHGTS